MNEQPLTPKRLDVVDSLRGFALFAIVIIHSIEHYNLIYTPTDFPAWLLSLDKIVENTIFFLFAGKAYATFSLLFGFSFYIQLTNARRRGDDFRLRFAWRMFLLFLFSQFHALFYNGDILLLYSVVGLALIPICNLKDKTILILAVICLLQPIEWLRIVYGLFNPEFESYGMYFWKYYQLSYQVMENGNFWEMLCSNIGDGQLYSNIYQVEHGRFFQTLALFMFGMLLGRKEFFVKSETSIRVWKNILFYSIFVFIPFYILKTYIFNYIINPALEAPLSIILPSLANFCFMSFLVSSFVLLWFKVDGYKFQRFIIPYGKMTLTNYIFQSIIGVTLFYNFGFRLYEVTGATMCVLIGICIFIIQWLFSRWWLSRYKQGPLEILWKKGTWIGK